MECLNFIILLHILQIIYKKILYLCVDEFDGLSGSDDVRFNLKVRLDKEDADFIIKTDLVEVYSLLEEIKRSDNEPYKMVINNKPFNKVIDYDEDFMEFLSIKEEENKVEERVLFDV